MFEIGPTANGTDTLFTFSGDGGSLPSSGVIFDGAGNLYGETYFTNANPYGDGTVFELSLAANGAWTEKLPYTFGATSTDGIHPSGGLIFDSVGNLYGATQVGGAHGSADTGGTVFELSRASGGGWSEKVLYSFAASASDGTGPSNVIFDANGNLYGETVAGGRTFDGGTVYMLTPAAGGAWTEKVVYAFSSTLQSFDYGDGFGPSGGLISIRAATFMARLLLADAAMVSLAGRSSRLKPSYRRSRCFHFPPVFIPHRKR